MVAALSPADINYDETLSTLRCVPRGVDPPCPPPAGLGSSGSSRCLLAGPAHLDFLRLQMAGRAPGASRAPFHFPRLVASSGPGPCHLTRRAGLVG